MDLQTEQCLAAWTSRRADESRAMRSSKLAEDFTDREQSREVPRRRTRVEVPVFAEDLAALVLLGGPIEPLVLHYLRDNPNPESLRQHAAMHANIARSRFTAFGKPWPAAVRRRAAVQARAQIMAARLCEQIGFRPRARRLP